MASAEFQYQAKPEAFGRLRQDRDRESKPPPIMGSLMDVASGSQPGDLHVGEALRPCGVVDLSPCGEETVKYFDNASVVRQDFIFSGW